MAFILSWFYIIILKPSFWIFTENSKLWDQIDKISFHKFYHDCCLRTEIQKFRKRQKLASSQVLRVVKRQLFY